MGNRVTLTKFCTLGLWSARLAKDGMTTVLIFREEADGPRKLVGVCVLYSHPS
jgi:hypothetical protein